MNEQVSVETTATLLLAAARTPARVMFSNVGDNDVTIGNAGVTAATGFLLPAGQSREWVMSRQRPALYGIADGGSSNVNLTFLPPWVEVKGLGGGGGGGAPGSVDTSLGGFDSSDAGKVPEFDSDGSLAATNLLKLYSGPGHTNVVNLDASAISSEHTQSFTDGSGILSLKVTDIPVDSNASGKPGMWAADTDFLYICTAADTWRRIAAEIF